MGIGTNILKKINPTFNRVCKMQKQIKVNHLEYSEKFEVLEKDLKRLQQEIRPRPKHFSDHYEYWRAKRITAIVEHYGEEWFKGKKILELGCGYGDIGFVLGTLGAEIIFAEGRKENCDILRERFPNNRIYQVNLENEWPFAEDEKFDMILHLGLLYHLDNFEFSLQKCAQTANHLVIETEVCDSNDENFVLKIDENSQSYDQSLIGKGSRPSAEFLEKIFLQLGFKFERVKDTRCNALFHRYDWPVKNTKTWEGGLRRFWFCEK